MIKRFTRDAREALASAVELAMQLGHPVAGPEHLLLGVYRSGGVATRVLDDLGIGEDELARAATGGPARQAGLSDAEVAALREVGIDADDIVRRAHEALGPAPSERAGRSRLSRDVKHVLERTVRESVRLRHKHLGTEHLLLAILVFRPELVGHGVTHRDVERRVLDELRRAG